MLSQLRHAIQGVVALLLVGICTILLTLVMFVLALFKLILPAGSVANALTRFLSGLGTLWVSVNKAVLSCYRGMHWDVEMPAELDPKGRYLVICNHQSWVDILVLQYCLNRRAPFMRFMLKHQLMWVPFLGVAWWALDMPFLRRHSRAELLKNPALRGKDLENAARACEKLKHIPVSMMAFPEGSRFTPAKHAQQKSPYQHLLLPRYGGLGQVLYSFNDAMRSAIDVTIFYPDGIPTYWQLISGQIRHVTVRARVRPIDAGLRGVDFREDKVAKRQLKLWLNGIWAEKDRLLGELARTSDAATETPDPGISPERGLPPS